MIRFLLILFIVIGSSVAHSQIISYRYLYNKYDGDSLFHAKNYKEALKKYKECLEEKDCWTRKDYYNLVICFVKTKKPDSAYRYLSTAVADGLRFPTLKTSKKRAINPYLQEFYGLGKWDLLFNNIEKNTVEYFNSQSIDSLLVSEFSRRRVLDQKYRAKDTLWSKQLEVDRGNQVWLDSLINISGWPTLQNVGYWGTHSALLIALHSKNNPSFQQKCLVEMKKLYYKGDVSLIHIAYLQDKILINKSKRQIFGTQFSNIEKLELFPVHDRKNLNKRRKVIKLGTIENLFEEVEKSNYKR